MPNKKLEQFKTEIKGKTVAVVGIGISNKPVIRLLHELGALVTARDKKMREQLGDTAAELDALAIPMILGDGYLENLTEAYILKAPGLRRDLPQLVKAVQNGAILTSEMELFLRLCPATVFAVTGSDGKTTTTTLTYQLLKESANGATVYVGGNIGAPLLPEIEKMTARDFAVLELSSFQLHAMDVHIPNAAITNLSPNHLNWHTDMQEYIDAKCRIFMRQTASDRLVLNYDNDADRALAAKAPGQVTFFSRTQAILPNGKITTTVTVEDGIITVHDKNGKHPVLKTADIRLPGNHNIENYMTAIALTWGYASADAITHIAKTFNGVAHRCELCREKDGVRYYNSSIDSSPTRTIAALSAFTQRVIVIMGGYDKHIPFEPLGVPVAQHAKAVILTGATAPKIRAALAASPTFQAANIPLYERASFTGAIDKAHEIAERGDIVLLSPACASFDAFDNFEQRGNTFKDYVNAL